MNKKFSLADRFRSFRYAVEGVIFFFKTEHNAWLHFTATAGVIILSVIMHVSRTEALALVIATALVWITEMLNTAIEKAMDVITQQYHPKVKIVKDVSAGAVLVAAAAALLIGLFVFVPKFIQ